MYNRIKCQPKCQKCEHNVFYALCYLGSHIASNKKVIFCWLCFPSSAKAYIGWGGKLNGHLMSSCVRNIPTKNCQNLIIVFQVTVENVGDVFWDTVYIQFTLQFWSASDCRKVQLTSYFFTIQTLMRLFQIKTHNKQRDRRRQTKRNGISTYKFQQLTNDVLPFIYDISKAVSRPISASIEVSLRCHNYPRITFRSQSIYFRHNYDNKS